MIELIFAIVIISVVVLSIPRMVAATQKSVEEGILQEVVFATSAVLVGSLSGYWDANSMEDANVSSLARVIDTAGDCNTTTRLRPGHINQPFHRRCLDSNTTTPSNATGTSYYTLDDAVAAINGANLFDNSVASSSGYKDTYTGSATITQTGDTKKIVVQAVKGANVVTKLIAYSANIGEPEYYKKVLP